MSLLFKILNALGRVTLPGSILLGTAALLPLIGLAPGADSFLAYYLPPALFLGGLILSAVFRRGRIFFAVLILAVVQAALSWYMPRLSAGAGALLISAIGLLLPLNFIVLTFLKERGIISPAGRVRLALLALQAAGVAALFTPKAAVVGTWLERSFLPQQFSSWSRLPQPALVAFLLAGIVLIAVLARRYSPVESGLLWALSASFVALRMDGVSGVAELFFPAAGAILLVSLLETSYKMAYHDELTQLPSRRALNEAMLKLPGWYTIAMVDVDHFKKFNDSYGHAAGDQALRLVASRLAHVAGGGKAYRYGGEEFALLFPGRAAEEVFVYLDRMRQHIEHSSFVVRGKHRRKSQRGNAPRGTVKKETNVTVSIGVASSHGERVTTAEVLRLADEALYSAKAKGRNCTVAATQRKGATSVRPSMRVVGAN